MWTLEVGQALGLRRPLRPPRPRPRVALSRSDKKCSDWIVFNVKLDAPEFLSIADQVIIALILPKGLTCASQKLVSPFGSRRFERTKEPRRMHQWSNKQVNVIGHDNPRVQRVLAKHRAVVYGIQHQLRSLGLPKEGRTTTHLMQQSVHGNEGLTTPNVSCRKRAIRGKRSVQTKSNEQRLADDVQMRQPALFQNHNTVVSEAVQMSQDWRAGSPPQAKGLRH